MSGVDKQPLSPEATLARYHALCKEWQGSEPHLEAMLEYRKTQYEEQHAKLMTLRADAGVKVEIRKIPISNGGTLTLQGLDDVKLTEMTAQTMYSHAKEVGSQRACLAAMAILTQKDDDSICLKAYDCVFNAMKGIAEKQPAVSWAILAWWEAMEEVNKSISAIEQSVASDAFDDDMVTSALH